MAGLEATELVRAIAMDDVARLTQVKGVGRKTAERLALELREKILSVPVAKGVAVVPAPAAKKSYGDAFGDLYGVLVQLGYKQSEIEPLFERLDPTRPVGDLVRDALSALRRQ
jgi:Holliday junction DNA helicase RuvA